MNLLSLLPDGRYKVNKPAVIQKLLKLFGARQETIALGVIPVSQREIEQEAREITKYNADNYINKLEE